MEYPTQLHGSGAIPASSSPILPEPSTSVSAMAMAASSSSISSGFVVHPEPSTSASVTATSTAPVYGLPPVIFSPARTHYDQLLARTIPGTTGLLLDRYLFPVDSSSAPSSASSSVRSFLPSGADPLTAITPLNARLSSVWAGSVSEVSVPTGVPAVSYSVPVSGSLSTSSLAASSPTSLSSGYIPYLAPTEVLRSVRALQELLFRLFPSEIRPASPDFDILEFLDKVFELLRSTGDVPTLLWIDVVLSRFTPAFASVYRHLARAGFVRFLVCVVDSTKLSADKIRERISYLQKSSNESFLNLSARLKQLLRLLRLALIHYPGSLVQEALKQELMHPDLVHQPASVHCAVQGLLEGTPLPVEDLQRTRVALFYATSGDAYHSFFLPRPVGDPTPETELFELMARCELCPIPPPPTEDLAPSSRLVQRHHSVATVWSDPDGPFSETIELSQRPPPPRAWHGPSRSRSHQSYAPSRGPTLGQESSFSETTPEQHRERRNTSMPEKTSKHNNTPIMDEKKSKAVSFSTQALPKVETPEQLLEFARTHGWTRKLHYLQRSTQSLHLEGSHPDDSPERCLVLLQRAADNLQARKVLQGFVRSMGRAILRFQQKETLTSSSAIHGVQLEDEKEPSGEAHQADSHTPPSDSEITNLSSVVYICRGSGL